MVCCTVMGIDMITSSLMMEKKFPALAVLIIVEDE